ncbi:MAG: DNA polymerase III subunit delta' [Dehalococcoidia bacterium]
MWEVQGQERAVKALERDLRQGRLAHAYLLVGPPHVGKGTLALNLAQAVNCLAQAEERPCGRCSQCTRIAWGRHADIQVITLERGEEVPRKEIGIDVVREVQQMAFLKPYEGQHRVFIFDGAEELSEEAANCLLKTLEEPPPQVLLVLLTAQEERLLPTLRSRCRRLELRPVPQALVVEELMKSHQVEEAQAHRLARLSRGCLGWAIQAAHNPESLEWHQTEGERILALLESSLEERFGYATKLASTFSRNRHEGREVLYLWLRWWRDLLLLQEGLEELVEHPECLESLRRHAAHYTPGQVMTFLRRVEATLAALDDNANARLALEALLLSLPERHEGEAAVRSRG